MDLDSNGIDGIVSRVMEGAGYSLVRRTTLDAFGTEGPKVSVTAGAYNEGRQDLIEVVIDIHSDEIEEIMLCNEFAFQKDSGFTSSLLLELLPALCSANLRITRERKRGWPFFQFYRDFELSIPGFRPVQTKNRPESGFYAVQPVELCPINSDES